jgi:uncharacterized protein YbaP (TraB family)
VDSLARLLTWSALALAASSFATAASGAPALWKVSDDDSAIWLFGSVHILDANVSWRTPAFDAALDGAEEVYFELLLDSAGMGELTQIAAVKGFLPPDQGLSGLLSKDQNKRLDEALRKLGVDRALIEPMRPWMAGLMISTFAMQQSGDAGAASFQTGVEMQLQAEVADDRERGLETAAEQLEFLSMGTEEEQAAALMETIGQLDEANAAFGGVIDAWLAGDVDAVNAEIEASVGSLDSPQYQLLITDRNRRWTEKIVALLEADVEAMIVVGAAHLAGPVGLPTLLAEKAFTVERVEDAQ